MFELVVKVEPQGHPNFVEDGKHRSRWAHHHTHVPRNRPAPSTYRISSVFGKTKEKGGILAFP